jgi:hypothetical protein
MRIPTLALSMLLLAAGAAFADPGVTVRVIDGAAVIELEGSWQGYSYNAFKGAPGAAALEPVLSDRTLCTGNCFVTDYDVEAGATYLYRFDLYAGDGSVRSYGPFAVKIPGERIERMGVRISPNPSRGPVTVELRHAGRVTDPAAEATLGVYDPQGRRLRTLFRGSLAPGLTRIAWDGRDERGAELKTGTFFLLLTSPSGKTVARALRVR